MCEKYWTWVRVHAVLGLPVILGVAGLDRICLEKSDHVLRAFDQDRLVFSSEGIIEQYSAS